MPKPILHKGGEMLVGIAALREQPKLAALMYEIITYWSVLDQHISMMFATLLHGQRGDPLEIYYSFFDESPRRRIFNAMAENRISEPLKQDIKSFFQSIRKASKLRNYVAHSIWGTSSKYPNCMLLLDGKHMTERMIDGGASAMSPEIKLEDIDRDLHKGMTIFRYYEKDFADDCEAIDNLSRESLRLALHIANEVFLSSKK